MPPDRGIKRSSEARDGSPRILIVNAYSSRNKGDAAIIAGTVRSLTARETFRNAWIGISTRDYLCDKDRYLWNVLPSFNSLKDSFSSNLHVQFLAFLSILLPLSLVWAFCRRSLGWDVRVPSGLRLLLRTYAESDMVIAAGGGYLYTTSKLLGNVVLLICLYSFVYGALLGKPVYLYAQSIGPFAGWWQEWLVKRSLRMVRLIQVREDYSLSLVRSWGLPVPVHRVEDAAFLVAERIPPGKVETDTKEEILVGVTVRKWFRGEDHQERYERTLVDFLRWLITERKARLVFVPQVTYSTAADDDRPVGRRISQSIAVPDRIRLVEEEMSPEGVMRLCGEMDYFVGTRMHSNIFALSMLVPALAIGYQPKTIGIMETLGLERYVVPIEDLSSNVLKEKFDLLVREQASVRELLRVRIPELRANAARAGELVERDYVACTAGAGRPSKDRSESRGCNNSESR